MSLLEQLQSMDKEARLVEQRRDIGIKREGTQIILPSDPTPMSIDEGIAHLQRRKKDEETTVAVYEEIQAFPFDGAYAFMKALRDIYGWASPVPTQGFFGPNPPVTVQIEVDYNQYAQIIWGAFKVPGIDGTLKTSVTMKNNRPIFVIGGEVRKKFQTEVEAIAERTRQFVKRESIYRGKAIKLITNEKGELDWNVPPSFLDVSRVNADELTFSDHVMDEIETNLFTPIEFTEACRKSNIALKRGVLLEGKYGTGKTLTAFVTAQKCKSHGWTFVLVDRVGGLNKALDLARMYQPAVVFAEDIDRATQGQTRTVQIDDILNTIDGIESKNTEIITVLTSNHAKDINKAMIRPGRLDAIITTHEPDAKAVQKLLRIYGKELIAEGETLEGAGVALAGQIPAVIAEALKRAKLYAITRSKGAEFVLRDADLVRSAKGMEAHLELMKPTTKELSIQERLGFAMEEVIGQGIIKDGILHKINTKVESIHERLS